MNRSEKIVYLEFKNLSKQFGYKLALKDANSYIASGDYISLFGNNGAGKTTLLYVLSGLYRRDSGEIFFPQKEISDFRSLYKKMHLLSHQSMFYSRLSAWENLSFFSSIHSAEHKISIEQVLEICELLSFKNQLLESFSRGMLQRLSLARMMLFKPSLVFLDEPFTGLDQRGQKLLHSILLERGMKEIDWQIDAFVLVEHNLEKSYNLCNRCWFVENGILVIDKTQKECSTKEIKERLD